MQMNLNCTYLHTSEAVVTYLVWPSVNVCKLGIKWQVDGNLVVSQVPSNNKILLSMLFDRYISMESE
jgi:hypothetical protein